MKLISSWSSSVVSWASRWLSLFVTKAKWMFWVHASIDSCCIIPSSAKWNILVRIWSSAGVNLQSDNMWSGGPQPQQNNFRPISGLLRSHPCKLDLWRVLEGDSIHRLDSRTGGCSWCVPRRFDPVGRYWLLLSPRFLTSRRRFVYCPKAVLLGSDTCSSRYMASYMVVMRSR